MALRGTITNLFAEKGKAIDIRQFIPPHLQKRKSGAGDSPEDVEMGWMQLQAALRREEK